MNPARIQFIRQKVLLEFETPLKGLDVLDVGCGGGLLSESLGRLGARTLGIDASEANIAIAKHHASTDHKLQKSLAYKHTSAEILLQEKKQFDVVCSMEVLEHVTIMQPSGHLFLSTMARTPLTYFLTIFMAENVLRKVASGTHTYNKYVNPDELVDFFQKKSWITTPKPTRLEVRGLIYNPLMSSWSLAGRDIFGSTACNYVFWIRKPAIA